jgi:uncharacterized protein (TIGR02453 family)
VAIEPNHKEDHHMPNVDRRFGGFSRESLDLLRQLEANNTRTWFAAHREHFQELLVEPALDLVVELGPMLRERISPDLRAEPRVGGSLLRLQRDARSHLALPFRAHLELWFWAGRGPSHMHPGFFVRIAPDELVLGAGIPLFPPDLLLRYREHVDQPGQGSELAALLQRLQTGGARIEGSSLQRVPRPFLTDHTRASLLRRTGLRAERVEPLPAGTPEAVLGPILPELVVSGFRRLAPLWRWLASLE